MVRYLLISVGVLIVLAGGFYLLNSKSEIKEEVLVEPAIIGELTEGGEANPATMKLDMKTWIWISALYNDGREIKPEEEGEFAITFESDGKFKATTDCNSMSGIYRAEASFITMSGIVSTKKFCFGSQEDEFEKLLQSTSKYHFTTRGELVLDLKSNGGSVVFK